MLKSQLPPIYSHLFPHEILQHNLNETKATCSDCLMAKPDGRRKFHYKADLKCCTFHPFLPNYIVGGIFVDKPNEEALRILNSKIDQRQYTLPIGVIPSVKYQVEFNNRKPNDFGNVSQWLCPYYNKDLDNCNVWRYRGSVCTSYYCTSDYGKNGKKYWDNLMSYLSYVESALAEEALVMLDFSPRDVVDLIDFINRTDGTKEELSQDEMNLKDFKKIWNGYYPNIVEFYIKCHKLIFELDRKSFQEIIGDQGEYLQDLLHDSYLKLEVN